ncbi:MAG: hypothetical protein AAF441_22005 [Pseudomonadota bacterium]
MTAGVAAPIIGGVGKFLGHQAAAGDSKVAEKAGRLKATQVGNAELAELNKTLSNIRAIRASVGTSESPTELAILRNNTRISDRNRRIKQSGLELEADRQGTNARLQDMASIFALVGGGLGGAQFSLQNG